MVLPIILSLLGSGAAGAGLFGSMSPLIAGAIGSGLGTAIQTGDLEQGVKSGLLSGLTGGIMGKFMGGAPDAAGLLGSDAVQGTAAGMTNAPAVNPLAGMTGAQMLPQAASAAPSGIAGMLQNVPSGLTSVAPAATDMTMGEMARQGLNRGILSAGGAGAALYPAMFASRGRQDWDTGEAEAGPSERAAPMQRNRYAPPAGYRPGIDPEFTYFSPRKMAGGGAVQFNPAGLNPIALQAGGLADIASARAPESAAPMNEKAIVQTTIAAVQGRIPEEQAAPILAKFVEMYGEDALRKLVDDVQSGRAGSQEGGAVRGPGDGMDDLVPARMDDGSSDVLLSDGEFVIPADVVSGLGNGSTEAGASELDRMMSRVRQSRTGKTSQPKAISAGGVMPA